MTDMIRRIRHRLKLLVATNSSLGFVLPVEFGDPLPVLAGLEAFIARGVTKRYQVYLGSGPKKPDTLL